MKLVIDRAQVKDWQPWEFEGRTGANLTLAEVASDGVLGNDRVKQVKLSLDAEQKALVEKQIRQGPLYQVMADVDFRESTYEGVRRSKIVVSSIQFKPVQ